MSETANMPVWAAVLVGLFLIIGAGLTLMGAIGLLRFRTFYERIHAPTLGNTGGAAFILLASMIFFAVTGIRPPLHELLILAFLFVTTPVTLLLLARAALYRDRSENNHGVPIPEGFTPEKPDGQSS